ncbi:amino acid ABC transporter permease [Desulfovibrio inopinatus]|uniref:amino acid ABC transporter permease n=1 Tax=Desulfovibrio inopinatus TaxID=102109 RepID=UPI0003F53401|nr:amino acid ABC transporter permease [Desulfovibrio inopinatus]
MSYSLPERGASAAPLVLLFSLILVAVLTGNALAAQTDSATTTLKAAKEALLLGDLEKAKELFLAVPAPGPDGDDGQFAYSRIQAAKLDLAAKDIDGGLAILDGLLKIYPDNIEATNLRASLLRQRTPKYQQILRDIQRFLPSLIKGAGMTLLLVVFTMIISPLGGLCIALGRISNFFLFSKICWFIIWLFRGTPLLLQLFFIYYGLPALGITFSPVTAALIGLGLNYSAYLAEIFRAGIQSIDQGQTEAAKALGMTYSQTMRRVILPQAAKRIIPPVANEFIALIKDTALVSTIAMVELMRAADQLFNTYFNVTVLVMAAAIYLLFTSVFTFAFERVEARLGVYEKR